MKKIKKNSKRLTRLHWLRKALEILAKEGESKVNIENISKKLGVTKGSFYWHFKNRDDFITSIGQYWADWTTKTAIDVVDGVQPASQQLLALMEFITSKDLGRYEMVMRSWAQHELEILKIVRKVDGQRLDFIRSLFTEMGFKGNEMEMRAQSFAIFHSLERGFLTKATRAGAKKYLNQRHVFFTRP